MRIVLATNNPHKLSELRQILGDRFELLSLSDIGCHEDIPEDFDTLEENSLQKAQWIYDHYHVSCFADDTGLEVEALGGAPGVHTARYADGISHDPDANIRKLLHELRDIKNRNARFRTVITLIEQGAEGQQPEIHTFEGIVEGQITTEKCGLDGFGYDPIFSPEDYGKTFAELGIDVKNKISHRARAVEKLADYLKTRL